MAHIAHVIVHETRSFGKSDRKAHKACSIRAQGELWVHMIEGWDMSMDLFDDAECAGVGCGRHQTRNFF